MEYKGQFYKEVLGSDVPNNGMYLELQDPSGKSITTVFRSDDTGKFEVHIDNKSAPQDLIESFVSSAKVKLQKRGNA